MYLEIYIHWYNVLVTTVDSFLLLSLSRRHPYVCYTFLCIKDRPCRFLGLLLAHFPWSASAASTCPIWAGMGSFCWTRWCGGVVWNCRGKDRDARSSQALRSSFMKTEEMSENCASPPATEIEAVCQDDSMQTSNISSGLAAGVLQNSKSLWRQLYYLMAWICWNVTYKGFISVIYSTMSTSF